MTTIVQSNKQGPLASGKVITPSEQLASDMQGLNLQDPTLESARGAEEEYFNIPPVQAQQEVAPPVMPAAPVPEVLSSPMEEVDTSALGQLRNQYIEGYKDLYGQAPVLNSNQAQDPVFLQQKFAELEEQRQYFIDQANSIDNQDPLAKEKEIQLQRLQKASIDHQTKQELVDKFNGNLSDIEVGTVYQFLTYLAEPLATSKAALINENQEAAYNGTMLGFAMQSLNLDKTQTVNAIGSAFLLTMNALARTKGGQKFGSIEEMTGLVEGKPGEDYVPFKEGAHEPTRNDFVDMLAAALGKVTKAGVAASGATEYQGTNNTKAAAQMLADTILSDGSFFTEVVKPDGKNVIRLTSYGTELVNTTNNFIGGVVEGASGRSLSVPATTSNYTSIGGQAISRNGDLAKVSVEGYPDVPPEFELAKDTLGSIGHTVDLDRSVLLKMVYIQAEREVAVNTKQDRESGLTKEALKERQQSRKKQIKLSKEPNYGNKFKLDGASAAESRATELAMEDKQRDFAYLADNIENPDSTRYGRFRYDPASGRMYLDSQDINSQRSKVLRAVMRGNSTPLMLKQRVFKANEPIYTDQQIENWWKNLEHRLDKKPDPNSLEAEMDVMAAIACALEPDTDGKTPLSILRELSLDKLQKWAENGLGLQMAASSVTSMGRKAVADFVRNAGIERDFSSLPQLSKRVFQDLFKNDPSIKRDNIGFKMGAYLDAYNFMQAKRAGTSFTPKTTIAIDMNSAGRAVLASDIGNRIIAARTGLIWQYTDDIFGSYLSENGQTPRSMFTKVVVDTSIDKLYTPKDFDIKNGLKALFTKYMNDTDFHSSFSKKVLLTTDYGKPAIFHLTEAKNFLLDNPEFADEFMNITGNTLVESMFAINNLYAATLREVTSDYQSTAPKRMVRLMQMVGTMFGFKGILNETIPLGGNMYVPSGSELIYSMPDGKANKLQLTKRVFDPIASSKKKVIEVWDDEKGALVKGVFDPGPGSAAVNAIGPFLGQYRESMILLDTINSINGGKKPEDMAYMMPVFDNFVLDAHSFARVMWHANNKATPKVLEWDAQESIYKDYIHRLKTAFSKLMELGNTTVIIDRNSKYYGVYSTLDYTVKNMQKKIEDGKLSESDKEFLSKIKANGYEYIENREQTNFVGELKATQIRELANAYMIHMVAKDADKWVKASTGKLQKPMLHSEIKQTAKDGMVFFMGP